MSLIHQHDFFKITDDYDFLLEKKVSYLRSAFSALATDIPNLTVFDSPIRHFRMRAEFGIWHDNDDCFYTMVKTDTDGRKQKLSITDFPVASLAINQLMPKLLAEIKAHAQLKQKLFQVTFLNTLAGDMLVTLIYHKPLDEEWLALAKQLENTLDCHIIGRSRKQKIVVSQDFVIEKLQVADTTFVYKQLEGGFTQPNGMVCQKMLTWASAQAQQIAKECPDTDLLELYCGNANFTLPLSRHYRKTLATEISKTSVAAAQWNIAQNFSQPKHSTAEIAIARLSAQELTEALQAKRVFRRLTQANIDVATYQFSTVFVDPPRAGIDEATLALLAQFDYIIYISCNPDTLVDNLKTLINTHDITAMALFDQFPYTHHIEAGVVLKKP